MKTMIAIPCMDMVPVPFMRSLLYLDKGDDDVSVAIESGSLIYDSRNRLLDNAINAGMDRILWFDSDMEFSPDIMQKLLADIDAGYEIVSGLYFKRRPPFSPVIYSECGVQDFGEQKFPTATPYANYPKGEIFEVEAFGFGCVMMSVEAAKRIIAKFGKMPFLPAAGFGEDLSFCMRARWAGVKLWCDSRVVCGHVGYKVYSEPED